MRSNKKISLVTIIALLFLPAITIAATSNPDEQSGNYNMVLISLVALMLILLFVIGALANTMMQLSTVVRDKMRKEKKDVSNVVKTILLILALSIPALHGSAEGLGEAVKPAVSGTINGIPVNDFYAIMTVIAIEILVIFSLVIYIRMFLKIISGKPVLVKAAQAVVKHSWFWDKFNAAAPLDREKDILLDHNYDGIQELDNSLPPWWKYGFYLTIIVAIIYIYRYDISHDGPSQQEEYQAEMQQGEQDKAAYLAMAGSNVDENSVTLLTEPSEIAAGKDIFVKTCAPCHLADGGGNVGPNLTDDYWLHGGTIKDIFKTIKYGWQDKGMKSWKDDFTPKQIQELASFVKSLKGTKPAVPKAPQGELYIEAAPVPATADSSKKVTGHMGVGK